MSTQLLAAIRRNYLPVNETQAFAWLLNFKTELPRFSAAFNISGTQVQQLTNAFAVYEHALEYAANAEDVYHERIANKNQAAWNPIGKEVLIRPFTARLNLANNEICSGGALTYAVTIADLILKANPPADVKDALRLNPLPKHLTVGKPEFKAYIDNNRLTVSFVKGDWEYFIAKIDYGTGVFTKEYTLLHSPWHDKTELPVDEPRMWRVQLFGYVKGDDTGIPGDIIDVAAKQYQAEHAEGAR